MRITNDLLAQYLEIEYQIKELTQNLDTIKALIKASGTVSTRDYVASVETRSRQSLPGIEACRLALGDVVDSLIKTTEYKIVRVSRKAGAA